MKVICAPDSFKESLTALEAAEAMARGVRAACSDAGVDLCPVADGGEGFVDTLVAATPEAVMQRSTVTGPLDERIEAGWAMIEREGKRLAIVELASAAGLHLVPPAQRDPTLTTTHGVGELIRHAIHAGAERITLGIGGSATNDAGCAIAQALGARFFREDGIAIEEPICGRLLAEVARLDVEPVRAILGDVAIDVACDVTNPFAGREGAAHVYGPQKGATPRQIEDLDAALQHMASLFASQMGTDIAELPGAGAAGGVGGGMVAMLGASLRPGIELVLDAVDFDRRVAGCDLCLTGEGQLDGQSTRGKACLGVAARAGRAGVATWAIVGSLGPEAERTLERGLAGWRAIGAGRSREESMREAAKLVESTTAALLRELS